MNFVWKTCEMEEGRIILLIFSCGGAFNVGGVGFIHQSAVTNSMHLQSTYTKHLQHLPSETHSEFTRNLRWNFFTEMINVLRPLPIFANKLHPGSLYISKMV